MLRENKHLIRNGLILLDGVCVLAAFFIAFYFRTHLIFANGKPLTAMTNYLWLSLAAIPVWWILLFFQDLYHSFRVLSYPVILWRLAKSAMAAAIILGTFVFIFQAKTYSRSLFGLYIIFSFILLSCARCGIKGVAHAVRRRGYNYRNVLIVGVNKSTAALIDRITAHPEWSFRVLGILANQPPDFKQDGGVETPYLGDLQRLPELAENQVIDEIIICADGKDLGPINDTLLLCEEMGIRTHIVADFFTLSIAKTEFGYLQDIPLLTFTTTPHRNFHLLIKRLIDIVFSAAVLLLTSPLFVLIGILIKLDSPGPVFFTQIRVGLQKRTFKLLKFRSMVQNAEELLPELLAKNEMKGPVFKIRDDPRITRVGRWLRKTSLDELPQLVNVLLGDMSLVGPRPPLPSEVKKYARWQRRRLSMKPGITCTWQISGRNEIDFEEWMNLDLQYIDHWSLGLDFKILLKTIPAVLTFRGAR